MKKITLCACAVLLLSLTACQPDSLQMADELEIKNIELKMEGEIEPLNDRPALEKNVIDRMVMENLQTEDRFSWDMIDAHALWSSVTASDSLVSIGYQPEGFQNLNEVIHEIDVNDPTWKGVRQALIDFVVAEEQIAYPDIRLEAEDILAFGEKQLPYINVRIQRYETLAKLRLMSVVRYVEPMGYTMEKQELSRSNEGCGGSSESNLPSSDYSTVSPGAKVSWNYYDMNIPAAWNYSQGDNIAVGVIDTGISPNQDKLNSKFSSGWSTNRYRSKYGVFVTGWWWWASVDGPDDDCGHGTAMAGTIAAPRTNAGSTVGVAYKSDLVSVRATDDVVINDSNEKDGVSDAFVLLGNRSDIKIISMSLGDIFTSGQVGDAVRYAHNRGKLIFAAAGTSLSWTSWWGVIFPANMSETVAVTSVKTGNNLQRCTTCHSGSQVDFVVTMEDRNNSNRTPITLHTSGNTPKRTGGSSVATATTAGVAALVWARNREMSRSQVLNKLKSASQFYPSRNGEFGWGRVDALQAVQ